MGRLVSMKAIGSACFAILLILSSVAAPAQRRNADREAAFATQSLNPSPGSRAEAEDFAAIQAAADTAAKLAAANKFLATYPTSQLSGVVNRSKMDLLVSLGQYREAVAAGELGLAQETQYVENILKRAEIDPAAAGPRDRNTPIPIDKNAPAFKEFV